MTIKSTIPALVAAFALGATGTALAQTSAQENTAATVGAGAADASPYGASAGGVTAGKAMNRGYERRSDKHERRRARGTSPADAANSASTYGAGALSTTRDSANVGVTTGASAAGSGAQSAGSTVDAYGETTRDGSNADLYGDSTAQSGDQRR